ncbi:unnamed protein product [Orchesella dallaii]|uniref:Uncharacterized protein n=1 Tax=Orchesella dallaii TaxID=48710 RepID=A0ABP1RVA6_9HEXA
MQNLVVGIKSSEIRMLNVKTLNLYGNSDCFINIVYDKENNGVQHLENYLTKEILFSKQFETSILTQTIHELNSFNFLPFNSTNFFDEEYESTEENINLQRGYLRFQQKYVEFCLVFSLLTNSFNETTTSIQKSGYGTSPNVLFLIATTLNEENEVVSGFVQNFFEVEGLPFHAHIVFHSYLTKEYGMFCYFCPEKLTRVIITKDFNNIFHQITLATKRVNSKGYGNTFLIEDAMSLTSTSEPCLKFYDSGRVRSSIFGTHVNCSNPELWELGWIHRVFNLTATLNINSKTDVHHKWFLRVRIAEAVLQSIPNVYLQSRGSIISAYESTFTAMACHHLGNSRHTFEFTITSALDIWTWSCLLASGLAYGLLFQNFWNGIDLLWIFFGVSLTRKHKRICVFGMLITLTVLSCIYQSLISADSMQLVEFPTLHQLFRKEGYRFWVTKTQSVLSFFRFRVSNVTSVGIKRFLGVEPSSPKIYFEGKGADNIATYSRHADMVPQVFAAAARLKALVTTVFLESVLSAIGKRVVFIGRDLVCKVYYPTADFPVPYRFTVRVWSYLSEKYGSGLTVFLESGCNQRIIRLKQATAFLKMGKMRLTSANSFTEPKPIGLISAVGTSCWVHCGLGGVLLLGWCFYMLKRRCSGLFKKLLGRIYYMWNKSTTPVMPLGDKT